MQGLITFSFTGYLIYTMVVTHITIMAVTIYLHRHQSHRAIELAPLASHFFRFWLWLTTGMKTKEWVAVHRCHHARVDTEADPHSPVTQGIHTILWKGVIPYRNAACQAEILEKHGAGTPNDWIENNLYSKYFFVGILCLLVFNFILLGLPGLLIWIVQMTWIPFFAAGVVNGIGHYFGYRNYDTADYSTNFFPIGIIIGGEELHNNHHAFPYAANLSRRWFELDIGYLYIKLFAFLGLAKIKYTASRLNSPIPNTDNWGLKQINQYKLYLLSAFDTSVKKVILERHNLPRRLKKIILKSQHRLSNKELTKLLAICNENPQLNKVVELKNSLYNILHNSPVPKKIRLLKDWCRSCQESKINCLIEFSTWLQSTIGDKQHV
ncbi:MAG: fatty acid desaturase [Pseudomonadota bacterium]|nr:fatty acid desaturase [Pseudomonadota bacterium]